MARNSGAVAEPVQTVQRSDEIREMFQNGMSRSDIAKQLDVSYSAVWTATKDLVKVVGGRGRTTGRSRIVIDGRPRTEVIREMAQEGKSRREIADELDLDYNVVWASTKGMYPKSEGEGEGEGEDEDEVEVEAEDGVEDEESFEADTSIVP